MSAYYGTILSLLIQSFLCVEISISNFWTFIQLLCVGNFNSSYTYDDDILQLSTEGEVNSGGYLPGREVNIYHFSHYI